jgi:putative transposase
MPFLKEIHSQVLQNANANADTAFQNFFKGTGFPKFKSRRASTQTFAYPQGVKLDPTNRKIYLPKIGWVKARGWRKLTGKVKTCTVSWTSDGNYHVSILLENDINYIMVKHNNQKIGLDLGVVKFATLSDGTVFRLPSSLAKNQKRLKKLHKAVSRKQKGSQNRKKAKRKLAKCYSKVANIRKDFAHKVSNHLSDNQAVVVEELGIKQMTKADGSHKRDLNREINNQGWYQFLMFLEYKLARKGGKLIKVNPAYTSQMCSNCGHISKGNRRSQSQFKCRKCSFELNADWNAAINILNRGERGDSPPTKTGYGLPVGNHVL